MYSGISNMKSLTSQVTLDHESVITNPAAVEPDKCYTLVDKICFIKKTQDQLKVTFPDGQSQINCKPEHLFSVLTVSVGQPVDVI